MEGHKFRSGLTEVKGDGIHKCITMSKFCFDLLTSLRTSRAASSQLKMHAHGFKYNSYSNRQAQLSIQNFGNPTMIPATVHTQYWLSNLKYFLRFFPNSRSMCSFLSDVSSKSDDLLSFKMNNNIDKENFAFDVLDSAGSFWDSHFQEANIPWAIYPIPIFYLWLMNRCSSKKILEWPNGQGDLDEVVPGTLTGRINYL